MKPREGIVLFAHGSREPLWSGPFEQLAAALRKTTKAQVVVAYLEIMKPSLEEAVASLDAVRIRIVPVFLGAGAHVRNDLPKLVEAIGREHPQLALVLEPPIGERADVIEAIAAAIARE